MSQPLGDIWCGESRAELNGSQTNPLGKKYLQLRLAKFWGKATFFPGQWNPCHLSCAVPSPHPPIRPAKKGLWVLHKLNELQGLSPSGTRKGTNMGWAPRVCSSTYPPHSSITNNFDETLSEELSTYVCVTVTKSEHDSRFVALNTSVCVISAVGNI